MHISAKAGSVNLDLKDEEKGTFSLSVSDYGGCDGSPPYSVEVEIDRNELDSLISALVDFKKDLALNLKNN